MTSTCVDGDWYIHPVLVALTLLAGGVLTPLLIHRV